MEGKGIKRPVGDHHDDREQREFEIAGILRQGGTRVTCETSGHERGTFHTGESEWRQSTPVTTNRNIILSSVGRHQSCDGMTGRAKNKETAKFIGSGKLRVRR